MRNISLIGFFTIAILLFGSSYAFGQDTPPPDAPKPQADAGRREGRANLWQTLGLSPEQIQQIRSINQERRPRIETAVRAVREANRHLDEAIYADTVDEAEVNARLRDLQTAQAQLAQLRLASELAIRQVLTPEQIARFRELRQQFNSREGKRPGDADGPDGHRFRRFNQGKPAPPN
jgi:Spy/CpxP family protein refolding chaperone